MRASGRHPDNHHPVPIMRRTSKGTPSLHAPRPQSVTLHGTTYPICFQDHGLHGFDLIVYAPLTRAGRLFGHTTRTEIARVSVGKPGGDAVLRRDLGRMYARLRIRVQPAYRSRGLGTWLLAQARQEAAARHHALAGELQARQKDRALAYYQRRGAQVHPRTVHPDHPWLSWPDGNGFPARLPVTPRDEHHREGTCCSCGHPGQNLNQYDVCRTCTQDGPPARSWNTPPTLY